MDAGFSRDWFAEALGAVDRFEDDQFLRYGVSAERVARVRELMRDWSQELKHRISREEGRRPGVVPDRQGRGPDAGPEPAGPRHPFPSAGTTGPSGGHGSSSRGPEIGF